MLDPSGPNLETNISSYPGTDTSRAHLLNSRTKPRPAPVDAVNSRPLFRTDELNLDIVHWGGQCSGSAENNTRQNGIRLDNPRSWPARDNDEKLDSRLLHAVDLPTVHYRKSCLLEEEPRWLSPNQRSRSFLPDTLTASWMEGGFDEDKFRNLIQDDPGPSCLAQTNVNYSDGGRGGLGGNGPMDNSSLKGSPQRVPPSTHPGPSPGYHGNHHMPVSQSQQGPGHPQGHGAHPQGHGAHPQGHGAHPQGHGAHPQGHGSHPNHQGHGGKNQYVHTQFPESPPDSGSEPYSPPNDQNLQHLTDKQHQSYNVKVSMAQGVPHGMYMTGVHGAHTGPLHPHGPPAGPTNMHSSMSPPHDQHHSPSGQHPSPPHPTQMPGHPPGHMRPYIYPMGVGGEPSKLQHPAATSSLPLNVHTLPNPASSMNNLANQPAKKRKFSDSPNSTINQHYIQQMVACMPAVGLIKQEPAGLLDCDDDYYDPQMFMDGAFQVIKWQTFQQNKWCTLLDENGKELVALNYRVDADKGFNFSPSDDSFVCQKKNHFQVTVHAGITGNPKFVKSPEGVVKSIEGYALQFNGIKAESTSQTIKVEQSQSDRTKRPFHPVKVEIHPDQVNKFTVGRMHFSETTSNNMRKKGKPNPDQRYFMLVVSLCANHGSEAFLLAAHKSERIIVRASNPGQFDSEVDVLWNKGRSPDSVVHMGRVGINNESPDEALTVHGNIHLTGVIVQPSDMRAKHNIRELDTKEQLKNINLMKVYKYAYNDRFANFAGLTDDEKEDTGVLAQELAEVLPEAVKDTGDIILPDGERIPNFMVVNKDRIFMESIGAVKELCKVTDKLETRINEIEGMDRKLTKYRKCNRDSMKSTCSSLSLSTCSTMSRSSSIRPSSDLKPTDKKSDKSSEKPAPDKDRSSSTGKNGGSTEHRHHHRHHHRSHHHHHHSQSSSRNPPPPPPTDGPCNNRLIQITVIVLVLVMAFCLISITVLYILERKLPESQVESTPPFFNSTTGSPTSTSDRPPLTVKNDTKIPLLMPPQCRNQVCNVTCCRRPSEQPQDDVPKQPNIDKHDSQEQDTQPKDPNRPGTNNVNPPGSNDPKYTILTDGEKTGKKQQKPSVNMWNNRDNPAVQTLSPKSPPDSTLVKKLTNGTKKKLNLVHALNSEDEPPLDDQMMINDIPDYSRDDSRDDPHDDPPDVYLSNHPEIVVMHSDGQAPVRRRRSTDFHNSPATLLFKQINKTIDEIYCVNDDCHHGGNYSYYIPMSSFFPQVYLSVFFHVRDSTTAMDVYICHEDEQRICDGNPYDEFTQIKALKSSENTWDLPIGFYSESFFKFRVAAETDKEDEVCQRANSLAGDTYSEYNLHFERVCDDMPSY